MAEKPCFVFKAKNVREENLESVEDNRSSDSLDERKALFEQLWQPLQSGINDEIYAANVQVISEVLAFVSNARTTSDTGRIPAGLLVTSASPSLHLFEQLRTQICLDPNVVYISLNSVDAPNLRTALKNILQKSIPQRRPAALRDEEDLAVTESGQKLLSYDFEVLRRWREINNVQQLVISLQSSESFDVVVLADLISFLQLWINRVPMILLFDIGTSISNLQDRLPAAAIRCLAGQAFDAAKTDQILEKIFKRACGENSLRFGPSLINFMFQRSRDFTQSIATFVQSLKYGYMCHFYGNSVSLFLDESVTLSQVSDELFEALRHLPSFRSHIQSLLNHRDGLQVRQLLESNEALFTAVQLGIREAQINITWLIGAVDILEELRRLLMSSDVPAFSQLYVKALSGELVTSQLLRESLMAVRKASPENAAQLASSIYDKLITMPASDMKISPDDFNDIHDDLQHVLATTQMSNQGEAANAGTKRSKQNMRKKAAARSSHRKAVPYSDVVTRMHDLLESYFKTCLAPMKDTFLHEIVFCDSKALVQNAMAPRPRASIERALSSPHDYLGCSCCSSQIEGPMSTQPSTAILYQLFIESGALVNVFDLWTAFKGIVEQQYEDEQLIMAMFFRALAELRYMEMLKPSRKRADHLGKLMWKGI